MSGSNRVPVVVRMGSEGQGLANSDVVSEARWRPTDACGSSAPRRRRLPAVLRNLFVENHGGCFTDPEFLDRLVLEKLEAAADEAMREGWNGIEVYPEYPYNYAQAMLRFYPQSVPLPDDEQRTRCQASLHSDPMQPA